MKEEKLNRIGVIDIGTHSVLFLAVEIKDNQSISILNQKMATAHLGKGLENQSIIQTDSFFKLINILEEYKILSDQYQLDKTIVVGTHALRKAQNQKMIIKEIFHRTNMKIEVLTEAEEAKWSYRGAVYHRNDAKKQLVCDIGGGSTEIILGNNTNHLKIESLPMGAVSLTEQVMHHNPPSPHEWKKMNQMISSMFEHHLKRILNQANHLIGVGGTVTTLAALNLRLKTYRPERVDGYMLNRHSVESLLNKLKIIPLNERKKILRFDPECADIILAGSGILLGLMKLGHFQELLVSDRGLRFGIVLRELNPKNSYNN